MMNEELKAVWKSLVEFCSRHQDVEDNRAIVAAAAELKELKELRDELVTMAKHLLSWIDDHAEIIDEELNAKAEAAIANVEGGAAKAPEYMPIQWPKARDVGRFGDMSPRAHLRVGLDSDNDAYASVWDEDGGASVEFCTAGAGGGKSSRTREALIDLMVAMEADNAADPSRDWWARRIGGKVKGGAA